MAAEHTSRLILIAVVAFILNRILRMLTRRLVLAAGAEGAGRIARMREQQVKTLSGILYSAGTAVILAGAVLTALPEFGFSVTPLAAAAGLASLAFGFGAQHLVRDFINGFFAIVEDQYVVGESVRIGTVVGRVEHLTLRRTVIRDLAGALVTIPNGEITQVANLSRDWGQIFVDVALGPDGSSEKAFAVLETVTSEMRNDAAWSPVLVDGPRVLGVETLSLAGLTLRLQLRAVPGRQDDAARELRRRIQNRFAQEGIRSSALQRVEIVGNENPGRVPPPTNS